MDYGVTHLGSKSTFNGDTELCAPGCTVAPYIIFICLGDGWSMGYVKSHFWHYKVAGNQVRGYYVTWIITFVYEFSVSCFLIYKVGGFHIEYYIRYVVSYVHNFSNAIFIIIIFFLASIYFHNIF